MYKVRRDRLKKQLKKEFQTEAVIIMNPVNIFYYTGFHSDPHERFFALAINIKNGDEMLFIPSLDVNAAEKSSDVNYLVPVADDEDAYAKFAQSFGTDFSVIGFEKNHVTVEQQEKFQKFYPDVRFVDANPFTTQQRLVKSDDEIKHVQQAVYITEKALEETVKNIKTGMTEQEAQSFIRQEFMEAGADDLAFEPLVLSGAKSALPHGATGKRQIENGDFLLFDIGVTVNGYHSDLSRTFVIGEESKEQRVIYNIVREANQKAIEAVVEGKSLKEIDLAARNYIDSKGYGEYFIHRVGHGLGLEVHELPSLHEKNEELIKPGMLFTIEPGIYVPEVGGVRIEDNIYIDYDGEVTVLSSFSKELKCL